MIGLSFGYEDKTVAQYLKDTPGFVTLASLLQSTGLDAALDKDGPYTVFAPTDDALRNVDVSGFTNDQLISILTYHVVPEFVLVPQISQPAAKRTLNNQTLTLEQSGGGLLINKGQAYPANVVAGGNDVIVNNGVIQPINGILIPPALPTAPPTAAPTTPATYNIYQLLLRDNRFQDLALASLIANITNDLEQIEMTLFAPTNAAFALYVNNLLDPTAPNAIKVYQEVLKYHVVPGRRPASALRTGALYTLHGTPVNITIGAGVTVNNANVIEADIMATNGVIHAIDHVLIPQDLYQIVGGRK